MVTIYTGFSCGPCIATKAAMKSRGVQFTELCAQDHIDKLADLQREHSLSRDLPFVVAGSDVWNGFQPSRIGDLASRMVTHD